MRDHASSIKCAAWLLGLLLVNCAPTSHAAAGEMKLEVQLLWGTNDKQSPDPKHGPVDADVQKKLKELPLKWSNYFLVNRKQADVSANGTARVPLSEKCAIEVKNLGHSTVEVSLFGKGEKLLGRTQALPKGEVLVLGGNAPNATSWLVVLKRLE
jgi:hypothetical protein